MPRRAASQMARTGGRRGAPRAPRGPDVEVRLCSHASARFFERLTPLGITKDELFARVREPNASRRDEWDPDIGSEKIRRWIRVEPTPGEFLTVRVVFILAKTSDDKVAIEVITVVPESKR